MLYLAYRKILSKVNVWLLFELTQDNLRYAQRFVWYRPRLFTNEKDLQIFWDQSGGFGYQLRQVSKLQERSQLVSTGRAAPHEIRQAGARRSGVLFLIGWP